MVSPGPNPLPAEVCIKRSAAFGDNFYYVDQKQWETKPFALKTYADPIQEMVQKMIGRCFIFSFALFEYQEDIDVKNFVPKLPLPHDACIHKLLEIVKAELGRCIVEVDSDDALDDADEKNLRDKFRITCERISNGFIAKQLLGTLNFASWEKLELSWCCIRFMSLPTWCTVIGFGYGKYRGIHST